ncbi:MAG: sulfite exporter TauE/SafE family protein [Bacteroidetes bacterium]|nr:MAG: sulfite exporter TauE/SafE family protein [Bacteroidota bacterium]
MEQLFFLVLVFFMAVLYSSVGHGGASGYLALMALFSFQPEFMRPSALVLNIFVSSIALFSYARNGHFRLKLLLPFIITSVPLAFLGGMITINPKTFKIILGIFLLIAIARMIYNPKNEDSEIRKINKSLAFVIGIVLGFLSGLIGIGGGIILSPVIILLKWATMKETAAVSAAFILVNSIAGLSGQFSQGFLLAPEIGYMLGAAILGGLLGSYMGSFKITDQALKYALSMVLTFASYKLLFL